MFRKNSIFVRIVLLILSGMVLISFILTMAATSLSERILLRQVVKSASANLRLMTEDLLKYNDQVTNTMLQVNGSNAFRNYITKPATTPLEQLNLVIALGRYMDLYKDYLSPEHSHIIVSALPGKGGRHYSSNALKWDKIPQDIVSKYMTVNGQIPNLIRYNSSPDLFADSVPYDNFIFATKPLVDGRTNLIYGYAAVVIDEQNIYQKYSPYLSKGIDISLVSSAGMVMSSSKREWTSRNNPEMLAVAKAAAGEKDGVLMLKSDKITYLGFYLPEYDAYLLEEIEQKTAFAPLYSISEEISKQVAIVLIASIAFVYLLSRRITRPLYQLVKTMQTSKGDSLVFHPLQESGSYETNVVANAYNRLIKEIEQYTDKLVIEQQERRKADLNALQMQINPHFLYNTLSTIKYLAKMHRTEQVDQTIDSLISMLQSTLGRTEDRVTVETEIETLKHYVFINQIRYGERIDVHYEVADDCRNLYVPKLILQPFVENAFFHAFPGHQNGNIHLFARRQGDRLVLEVMDDGIGMSAEASQANARKRHHLSGIGIDNVHSRLQLLYGPGYGVRIESEPGYGTAVKITLPISESGQD
ncbi:sensor histidine kinase [Cohnella sp. AR92]|uniref:sensor histidine kinase n=1 Tax=Cohnella sp. AR92 TaxID=648716 RepID=UPI000F8DED83|nr:sensor histidine kinase [Cohnella sp. AR92]RUS46104.1 sensor histidine kinase [Cohnella sp. AR92]